VQFIHTMTILFKSALPTRPPGAIALCSIALCMLIVTGCSKAKGTSGPPPPEVEVVAVEQKDVPIYTEWIGTLDGMVNAEIKAQVQGYLLTKNYTEGSLVRKGQLLFQIDPRPFQAALDQAKGDLAKAEGQVAQANGQLLQARAQLAQSQANQVKARHDVERYTPLEKAGALTSQQLDDAVQANLAAIAQVKAAEAGVETANAGIVAAKAAVEAARGAVATAQVNLGFTKITSLIDGIAGIAPVQIGNLVNPASGVLTTVSTVDPIKVLFTATEQEYLNYTRQNPTQGQRDAAERQLELEIVLADQTVYQHKGKFFVADRNVDQKTGAIALEGVFPNPGNILRPGQYAKVRASTTVKKGALLVPQRAVTELQGVYQVAVVGDDNKVSIRPIKLAERVGSMWIVEDGLKPGENVVAEGTQKVRPDQQVSPKPFVPPSPSTG
jgi:RND family efflux transporter MFP subunit